MDKEKLFDRVLIVIGSWLIGIYLKDNNLGLGLSLILIAFYK